MNIEKVIQIHEKVLALDDASLVIATGLMCTLLLIFSIRDLIKNIKDFSFSIKLLPVLIILLSVEGYSIYAIAHYDFSLGKEQWKKDYLIPYVMSQREHKVYVEDFSQLLEKDDGGVKSIHFGSKVKPVWVKLSLLDSGGSKNELITQAVIKKEPIKRTYLTYKKIKKDISEKYIDNAYYETVLHIPEDYKVLGPVYEAN